MKNLVTKKNILLGALVGLGIASVVVFQENVGLCTLVGDKYYRNCLFDSWVQKSVGVPLFTISFSVLILSLSTYKLRDQVFYTWLKFSAIAIPIMLWIIYQSPTSGMGGFLASAMTTTRSETAIQVSVLYVVISLLIIGIKALSLREK